MMAEGYACRRALRSLVPRRRSRSVIILPDHSARIILPVRLIRVVMLVNAHFAQIERISDRNLRHDLHLALVNAILAPRVYLRG
jgi:hypothetical protein